MTLKLPVAAATAVAALSLAGAASACDTPGFLHTGQKAMATLGVSIQQAQAGSYTAAQTKAFQAYGQAAASPMPCGSDSLSARKHLVNGLTIYTRGLAQMIGGHPAAANTMVENAAAELAIATEFLKNSHGR